MGKFKSKENLVKHQKVAKDGEHDCGFSWAVNNDFLQ